LLPTIEYLSLLDPPEHNVKHLNEFRPDVLGGYGSYLEALFAYLRERRPAFHRPAAVWYSSDAMSEAMRRVVTDDFGIPVFSAYRANEAFHIGFECEAHRGFHLNIDLYPVRIIGRDLEEVPDGESGDVVVSNLVSRGTVLLNYRLGDVASKLPGRCPCGRALPMLSFLQGRTDDWIASPSGKLVHPQSVRSLFAEEHMVWRYQTVQQSPAGFSVAVVAAPDCDRRDLGNRLTRKFVDRFGPQTTVEIRFVSDLPRTNGGKVRPVIRMRETTESNAAGTADPTAWVAA
jgi:phenylacetate-CoA ligase